MLAAAGYLTQCILQDVASFWLEHGRARSCGIAVSRIAEKSLSNPCQGSISRQAYDVGRFVASAPWLLLGVEVSLLVAPRSKHVPRFNHAKSMRGASDNITLWASDCSHFQHGACSTSSHLARLALSAWRWVDALKTWPLPSSHQALRHRTCGPPGFVIQRMIEVSWPHGVLLELRHQHC
jgi:hypothetical protein